MNNKFTTLAIIITVVFQAKGQLSLSNGCNESLTGKNRYAKDLPNYICIPDGFIIDDYIRTSDLDGDNLDDALAVKYNRKEDDQEDGEKTYWAFYRRINKDSIFRPLYILDNIVPPFIKNTSWEYLEKRPEAEKLYFDYPRRLLGHDLSFQMHSDSIKLSFKIDDSYGKSFVFLFSVEQNNWLLKKVEYFFGELPLYWWGDDEFYYPLAEGLKIIEIVTPRVNIPLDQFDLKEAFKYRDIEFEHLTYKHIDKIDRTAKTILGHNFQECDFDLPGDWKY